MFKRLKGSKLTGAFDVAGNWWPEWWGKYVGTPMHEGGGENNLLTAAHCKRLASLSLASRSRVRQKHMYAEFVDLIEVGIVQEWKCFICGLPMEQINAKRSPKRISVEHDPPLSKIRMHTRENVHLAHWDCNNRKGNSHSSEQDGTGRNSQAHT